MFMTFVYKKKKKKKIVVFKFSNIASYPQIMDIGDIHNIFLISPRNVDCGYSLEATQLVFRKSTHKICFHGEMTKYLLFSGKKCLIWCYAASENYSGCEILYIYWGLFYMLLLEKSQFSSVHKYEETHHSYKTCNTNISQMDALTAPLNVSVYSRNI